MNESAIAFTLLGLVSKAAGLVGTSRTAGAVDGGQLAVLPAPHTEEEAKHIRLLLLPEFFEVFVSSLRDEKKGDHGVFQSIFFWFLSSS